MLQEVILRRAPLFAGISPLQVVNKEVDQRLGKRKTVSSRETGLASNVYTYRPVLIDVHSACRKEIMLSLPFATRKPKLAFPYRLPALTVEGAPTLAKSLAASRNYEHPCLVWVPAAWEP